MLNKVELEHFEGEDIDDIGGSNDHNRVIEGRAHFQRLGWKRLTVVLIVQSIALGSLSLPAAFATLGMVPGVIFCIGMGIIAIYASYNVGQVKLKYPHISHYADIGGLLIGNFGDRLFSAVFVTLLILVIGSHCLTGTLALTTITESTMCSLIFSAISALVLFSFAIPPSFAEVSILGYLDFASILVAIGICVIATGIQRTDSARIPPVWSLWPRSDLSFSETFVAISNIVFAYAFAAAQPSFMDEMRTPKDFTKSIYVLGITQMTIYTLTGALLYAFMGQNVQSPALLSAGPLVSKVAFGFALPVIFISGSINTTVACRFIHGRIFRNSVVRYVNTPKGWVTWLALTAFTTLLSWVVAEAIPFFLSCSLFAVVYSCPGSRFMFPQFCGSSC